MDKIKIFSIIILLFTSVFSYSQKTNRTYEDMSDEEQANFEYFYHEGLRYKLIGDYQNSVKNFGNCLSILPSSSAVQYELADVFLMSDDLNRALVMARNAAFGTPSNIWYKIRLANVYQKKSMIEEACKIYESIIQMVPDEEKYYIFEAGLYASVEKWAEALSVYDKYEKQFGISEALTIEKLKLCAQSNNYARSEFEIKKLIKKYPDNNDYKLLLSELYFSINKEKEGLKVLKNIIKSNKDAGNVYFSLADYYYNKKNYPEMDKSIINALNSNNIEVDSKIRVVYEYFTQEDSILNTKYISSYIDILSSKTTDNLLLHSLKADYFRYMNNIQAVRNEYEAILSIEKNEYSYWEAYLFLLNTLNDYPALLAASNEAITFFPDQPIPYFFAGMTYSIDKKYDLAIPFYENGLKLENLNANLKEMLKSSLADSYYNIDSIQKAFNMYEEILSANPNQASVLNNYAYYLSIRKENLSKAERMASQAVTINPNNNTFLDTYAWVFFVRKDYSMALYYMKKIIESGESDLSSIYFEHYGDILYMNDKKEQAIEMWKKAIELNDGESSKDLPAKIDGTYKFED